MRAWLASLVMLPLCVSCMADIEAHYKLRDNTYLTSDSPSERTAISPTHCAQLCTKNPDCSAANFDHVTSNCQLLATSHGTTSVQSGSSLILQGFKPVDGLIAFWPLNARFGGRDLINSNSDLQLHDASFSDAGDEWSSPPAYFSGTAASYAVTTTDSAHLALPTSFSWMAAVYQEANNAPLMEMDFDSVLGLIVWINGDRFYARVNYPTCPQLEIFFSGTVADNEWFTVAVSYSHDSRELFFWKNGVKEMHQIAACSEQVIHQGVVTVSVGKRTATVDNRYLNGRVTCMSLYDRVMTYEEMYSITRPFCKD